MRGGRGKVETSETSPDLVFPAKANTKAKKPTAPSGLFHRIDMDITGPASGQCHKELRRGTVVGKSAAGGSSDVGAALRSVDSRVCTYPFCRCGFAQTLQKQKDKDSDKDTLKPNSDPRPSSLFDNCLVKFNVGTDCVRVQSLQHAPNGKKLAVF